MCSAALLGPSPFEEKLSKRMVHAFPMRPPNSLVSHFLRFANECFCCTEYSLIYSFVCLIKPFQNAPSPCAIPPLAVPNKWIWWISLLHRTCVLEVNFWKKKAQPPEIFSYETVLWSSFGLPKTIKWWASEVFSDKLWLKRAGLQKGIKLEGHESPIMGDNFKLF